MLDLLDLGYSAVFRVLQDNIDQLPLETAFVSWLCSGFMCYSTRLKSSHDALESQRCALQGFTVDTMS